jgi:PKD repeat protein
MFNDIISVKGTEFVEVPAGSYDSIIVGGTWGHHSFLWYAPDAGYLVKVDEVLNWENGSIESVFHLNLLETNYDISNDPPNPPDKPYGNQDGEVEIEYFYSTHGTDPNCDDIKYKFDWGDGTDSGWLGPYSSGSEATASHIWYSKGLYNVKVKAKDASGLESCWSEPLPVLIKGFPDVKVTVYQIDQMDEIDIGSSPELYYTVSCLSEGMSFPPQTFCNTDDGTYDGDWNEASFWVPDKEHNFKGYSRYTTITIKLMDQDDRWDDPLHGVDDLADVSGCNGGGVDNDVSFQRGAIYHGTYDLVEKKLKPYDTGTADENADYVFKQDGYYITSGENQPDNSDAEDENDAEVWFTLYNNYISPDAEAVLLNEYEKIRPNQRLNFNAVAQYGVPDYSWHWDFGDEETSTEQNPTHIYTKSGTYIVTLTLRDGFGQTSTDTIEVVVENDNPVLSKDKVQWTGSGALDDTFTFSVHYIDPDGDKPLIKDVIIDDKAYMLCGFGSNTDYTLDLIGRDIGQGTHKFYFHFDDGYGGSVTTPEKTFSVAKSKIVIKDNNYFFERILNYFPIFQKLQRFINNFN